MIGPKCMDLSISSVKIEGKQSIQKESYNGSGNFVYVTGKKKDRPKAYCHQ